MKNIRIERLVIGHTLAIIQFCRKLYSMAEELIFADIMMKVFYKFDYHFYYTFYSINRPFSLSQSNRLLLRIFATFPFCKFT